MVREHGKGVPFSLSFFLPWWEEFVQAPQCGLPGNVFVLFSHIPQPLTLIHLMTQSDSSEISNN